MIQYSHLRVLTLALLLTGLSLVPRGVEGATLIINDGFESGIKFSQAQGITQVVTATSPVSSGKASAKFLLTNTWTPTCQTNPTAPGCDNDRTELTGIQKFNFDQEYWMGFTYLYRD